MMKIKYIPSSFPTNSTFRMFFHILDIFFYVIYLIFMYCLYCFSSIRIISVSFIICFSPTFFTLRMSFTFCFVSPGEFFFVLPLFTFCTLFFHKIKIKVEALGDEPQALGFSDPRANNHLRYTSKQQIFSPVHIPYLPTTQLLGERDLNSYCMIISHVS